MIVAIAATGGTRIAGGTGPQARAARSHRRRPAGDRCRLDRPGGLRTLTADDYTAESAGPLLDSVHAAGVDPNDQVPATVAPVGTHRGPVPA